MPTIDQLSAAAASADTDELPVSQNGIVRKVTRAQLLANVQRAIAVPSESLLGRTSAGVGSPETIAVGANLILNGGTLAATAAPYSVGALPVGQVPGSADRVALAQAGMDAAVGYAQFMAGIATLPGIDASHMTATAAAASTARTIAEALADAVAIEAFGAKGDGVTDDSSSLSAAIASGRPVRFGPKTYVVNGQFTIAQPAVLFGVRGLTVLRRAAQTDGGAWLSIQGASFAAHGMTFDANRGSVAVESWGVLVTASCLSAVFEGCAFANAQGSTLGCGLTFLASDPVLTQHVVRDCEAHNNTAHGIWVQAVAGVQVLNCRAHDNGGYGICLDYTDPHFVQKVRLAQVLGNRSWNNQRGISVGNFNATNTDPPVWGNANPDAISIVVADNDCHDNVVYGIAVAGSQLSVRGNMLSNNGTIANGGAGILANVSFSAISGNVVSGAGQYGIDAGGSIGADLLGNEVSGYAIGLNPGGSQNMRIAYNAVRGCTWGITFYNVETDGHGANFGQAAATIAITDNWIEIDGSRGGGIYLIDAPQGVLVARNSFIGLNQAAPSQALWAHTNSVIVRGNTWNNAQRLICNPVPVNGMQQVQFPDFADSIMITTAPAGVQSMMGAHQAAVQGQITYISVTSGGSGYTQAQVAISGAGQGASAIAYIANGAVIGIAVTNSGTGYTPTTSVTITGDGVGAVAVASVGLPVWEERRLRVACNCAVHFIRAGSSPFQDNWTEYDITMPAASEIEWVGTWGGWRAAQFSANDYIAPPGDGSLQIRTVNSGDLVLRPGEAGRVRLASDGEAVGAASCIGRGSPTGVVAAPPGSDYRNLDGGAGSTLWVKQSGTDASGWAAIA